MIFGPIVVDGQPAVFEIAHQCIKLVVQIPKRLGDSTANVLCCEKVSIKPCSDRFDDGC